MVCAVLPGEGVACLGGYLDRCQAGLACVENVCRLPPGKGEACRGPEVGVTAMCREGLVCGAKLCSMSPSAPGCSECQTENCVVQVCMEEPPAVCGDSGGLLY